MTIPKKVRAEPFTPPEGYLIENDREWDWFYQHRQSAHPPGAERVLWSITNCLDEDGVNRGSFILRGYRVLSRAFRPDLAA